MTDKKNPNDMTLDECRDELARNRKYACGPGGEWWDETTGDCVPDHPIPATLDEAAKLREGWVMEMVSHLNTECRAYLPQHATKAHGVKARGDTELEARFRLRVAVERAEPARQR